LKTEHVSKIDFSYIFLTEGSFALPWLSQLREISSAYIFLTADGCFCDRFVQQMGLCKCFTTEQFCKGGGG